MPARVAVIEDDEATRDLLVKLLEGAGYGVDAAPGGEPGIAVVERERPDIVLLDLLMPGMDGFEVCQRTGPDLRALQPRS